MPLLSAEPRVTRSSRSCTAESSCAAGTTRLTRPQSSAVWASMTSPDRAISMARFRPVLRAIATMGVWQNQPPLPPGAANPTSSLATTRSAVATSWQPAAVARPCTRATTGCGTCCISDISLVQVTSRERTDERSASATSAKSCPALNTGPLPARTMPTASLSPTWRNAVISSRMCARDSALRRCGRFIVIVTNSPDRSTRMCSNPMAVSLERPAVGRWIKAVLLPGALAPVALRTHPDLPLRKRPGSLGAEAGAPARPPGDFLEPGRFGADARTGYGGNLDGGLEGLPDQAAPVQVGPGEPV